MSWGTDQQGYGHNHANGDNYGYEYGQQPYPQEPYPQQYVDYGQVAYEQREYAAEYAPEYVPGYVEEPEAATHDTNLGDVDVDGDVDSDSDVDSDVDGEENLNDTRETDLPNPPKAKKPAGRDRYFDTLRAIALVRVVAYHTFGWAWAGMVFPSMGIMFALAGTLMAKSLERPALKVIRSRVRRLLPPSGSGASS